MPDASSQLPTGLPISVFGDPLERLLQVKALSAPSRPGLLATAGRYEVLRVVGQGGMGIVVLARDQAGGNVALKFLRPELLSNRDAVERFLAEARHMQRLRHPSILRVIELVPDGDCPYFVMPYLERGSLAQLLKARQPLPAEQAVQIGLDVARALVEAHARGIIHRDLKPANVLLGDDGIARVTDFGLARTVFNDVFVDPGQLRGEGTAPYMSPAVARGEAEDTRCDVYGLGALLYEMLTGRPPYEGASTQEILDQLVAGPPVPIREINPSASRRLTRVAEGSMGRDLRQRYATMKDVVDDLERVERNEDPQGPYAGWIGGSRAWNPPLRKVSVWIGSAAVLLVLWWLFADLVPNPAGEEVTNFGRAPAQKVWDSPRGLRCHTNSLGMVFVAVPGIAANFCIWETRVKDFRAFVDATAYDARGNFWSLSADGWEQRGRDWMSPGFPQSDEHPVSGVSWLDAQAFCEWLTESERSEGRIGTTARYRLPTDAEWSAAVGSSKFTWGEQWPPLPGTGNFAGEEAVDADWPKGSLSYSVMKDWSDGYARTSPVGWYRANRHGIYDLEGNVLEWCEDWYRKEMNTAEVLNTWPALREDGGGQTHRTLRGASCLDALILGFTSNYRVRLHPAARYVTRGFRCVWEDGAAPQTLRASE